MDTLQELITELARTYRLWGGSSFSGGRSGLVVEEVWDAL